MLHGAVVDFRVCMRVYFAVAVKIQILASVNSAILVYCNNLWRRWREFDAGVWCQSLPSSGQIFKCIWVLFFEHSSFSEVMKC